ncbi:ATP-binding protein [Streptomyces kebangsaanensis]|uniref:ATP-binding protein n=1 Tax=Streptomyces kebangsaanensis TaxID=864058 RepID=UPI000939CB0D|nr:ATP-binding protein [Streptomyces kebangsaanensis]
MPEPTTLAENQPKIMARLQEVLAARGLDLPAGPIDDAPTPDEPGHPEYHRRQRITVALSRWETATPYRYQQATATHPQVTAWADRVVADPRTAGILLLTGPFGTGKTHQAYGALHRIAQAGVKRFEMVAMTSPDMYGLLRPGGSEHGVEHEIKRLGKIPLLLIDDLGTEKISEFTEEATYRLLNERYNECRPLIITTNLPARADGQVDLVDKLGERIVSRLAQIATIVPIEGADRRRDYR